MRKMSKRKRNQVLYTKPELPSFLKKIREQIAYKDERLADLEKRQKLAKNLDEKYEGDEEKPQVIVLKKGDLTAEEADTEQRRIEKEENERPADLNRRIVFKSKVKSVENQIKDSTISIPSSSSSTSSSRKVEKEKNKKSKATKSKLSFNDEEDETEN